MSNHIFETYRIDRLTDEDHLDIGERFPIRKRNVVNFNSPQKRNIESVFEYVRMHKFPQLISRLDALFVFPEGKEYEDYWCNAKFRNNLGQEINYVLYKLDLEGDIVWLDSEYFDECLYSSQRNMEDSAKCYWKSNDDRTMKKYSVEGFFKGTAIVSKVQIKSFFDK